MTKINLLENVQKMVNIGYAHQDAMARVCQDVILKAISESTLSRNVTIKGGVVMRSKTGNIRRATQDIDIDFIKYSLNDIAIDAFIRKINSIEGLEIRRIGKITELKQQDYKGKRVFVEIMDSYGQTIESKIDLGVHNRFNISQEEYCFDIAFDDEGASLLINTKEQMIAEKLRSLLKFGRFSTRYKDIYDIFYQRGSKNTPASKRSVGGGMNCGKATLFFIPKFAILFVERYNISIKANFSRR